jgi:predicted AlkP superfamily phosphohydrolase/phosphomutase
MFNRNLRIAIFLAAAAGVTFAPGAAHAYIGPGAGFALISSFLTLVIAFFTAFFALITFPVRVVIKSGKRRRSLGRSKVKKVIMLGLDGIEPTICERMVEAGELPNLKKLRESGSYSRLGTATPALSPVAWSTFATGADSSRHAIYDFLSRDARTYLPRLSSSEVYGRQKFFRLGPIRIPYGKGGVRMLRKSKTFWRVLSDNGVFSSVLRVPITFPVEKINGVMIAGMCVPDLRGSQGSFTYFTTSPEADKIGGLVIKISKNGSDAYDTEIPGPASPIDGKTLKIPLSIQPQTDRGGATITVDGTSHFLEERTYTPWIRLAFKAAAGVKLNGIVRFYVTELGDNVGLYMTPIHIDPEKPAMPVSHPSVFATYLAKLLGPYGTLGLAEDTWAMNERVLDEKAWLEQAWGFHEEREKMWFHSLDRLRDGMVVCVFDISDRLQHMFFRYLDDDHPANQGKDTTEHKNAISDMYRRMDDLVGETMKYVDDKTALFVLSDHGFKTFKRGVNLNTWLVENGFMTLKEGAGEGEYLSSVDWEKTQAYCIGLGGIYINIKGRERNGIVDPADVAAVKRKIIDGITGLKDEDGGIAMRRMIDVRSEFDGPYRSDGPELIPGFAEGYRDSWDCARGVVAKDVFEDNTKSWSGDHCMDPEIVPGILFSNKKITDENPRLMDMGPTALDLFGVDVPKYMTGKNIL